MQRLLACQTVSKVKAKQSKANMFEQIVQFAKFTFALGILMWGGGAVIAEDERAGAFYILSMLYVLYLVWGHGFKAGEREGRQKEKFADEKTKS